jgi:succinate-acetate transporter protein
MFNGHMSKTLCSRWSCSIVMYFLDCGLCRGELQGNFAQTNKNKRNCINLYVSVYLSFYFFFIIPIIVGSVHFVYLSFLLLHLEFFALKVQHLEGSIVIRHIYLPYWPNYRAVLNIWWPAPIFRNHGGKAVS